MPAKLEQCRPYIASKVLEVYAQTGSKSKAALAGHVRRDTVRAMLERNPEDVRAAQKMIATQALSNSSLFANSVTPAKARKLNGLQLAIAAKVSGQHALEMLGTTPPAIQINVAVLESASRTAEYLHSVLDRLKAMPLQEPDHAAVIDVTPTMTDPSK